MNSHVPPRTVFRALMLLAALHGAARAQDYSALRLPETHLRGWRIRLDGNGSVGSVDANDRSFHGGSTGLTYERLDESDANTLRLRTNTAWGGSTAHTSNGSNVFGISSQQDERRTSQQLTTGVLLSEEWYAKHGPWNVSATTGVDYSLNMGANRSRFAEQVPSFGYQHDDARENSVERYEGNLDLDLRLGIGRIRDISTLTRLLALEERLRRSGALTRLLTSDERVRLAQMYGLSGLYGRVHDRSGKRFWPRFEQELIATGAVRGDTLSSFDRELIQESPFPSNRLSRRGNRLSCSSDLSRAVGHHDIHTVARTFEFQSDTLVLDIRSDISQRTGLDRRSALWGVHFESATPWGWFSSWENALSVQYGDGPTRALGVSLSSVYERVLTNQWRVEVVGNWQEYSAVGSGHRRASPAWSVGTHAGLIYAPEDAWQIGLTIRHSQVMDRGSFSRSRFGRGTDYSLGIQLHPGTWFSAPAFGILERRVPRDS